MREFSIYCILQSQEDNNSGPLNQFQSFIVSYCKTFCALITQQLLRPELPEAQNSWSQWISNQSVKTHGTWPTLQNFSQRCHIPLYNSSNNLAKEFFWYCSIIKNLPFKNLLSQRSFVCWVIHHVIIFVHNCSQLWSSHKYWKIKDGWKAKDHHAALLGFRIPLKVLGQVCFPPTSLFQLGLKSLTYSYRNNSFWPKTLK